MMIRKKALLRFAKYVAEEVTREDFEEFAGAFAEIACRKLHNLGVISTDGENWIYKCGDD